VLPVHCSSATPDSHQTPFHCSSATPDSHQTPFHCSSATPDSHQTPLQCFPLNTDRRKQFQMKIVNVKTCRVSSLTSPRQPVRIPWYGVCRCVVYSTPHRAASPELLRRYMSSHSGIHYTPASCFANFCTMRRSGEQIIAECCLLLPDKQNYSDIVRLVSVRLCYMFRLSTSGWVLVEGVSLQTVSVQLVYSNCN